MDNKKEYGLVLEGGGAKGAYQIGVWKALLEHKVKIKGVAGVSVGALNGALICMGDYKKAEQLWKNISYRQIMDIDNKVIEKLIQREQIQLDLKRMLKEIKEIIKNRGIDIEPLKKLIEDNIEETAIRISPIEFVFGVFDVKGHREVEVVPQELEEGTLKDFLLASAYFPAFKRKKINGNKYLDGGVIDNVPIDMLLKRGYKDIIVIRIFGPGHTKKIKIPKDINMIEIIPREDLGSFLEFSQERSIKNLQQGYKDCCEYFT